MPTYAKETSVPVDRSKAEIERTLQRYGASAFMYGWDERGALIGFVIGGRRYRIILPLPSRDNYRMTEAAGGARAHSQSPPPGSRDSVSAGVRWRCGSRRSWKAPKPA